MKIVNLNIEGDKHLPEVSGLIERERPEVVCLQEVFEEDFEKLAKKFGMKGVFVPTMFVDEPGLPGFKKRGIFGIAMLGKLTGKFMTEHYSKWREQNLPAYGGKPNADDRVLIWQKISDELTIAATHFTWSKGGRATEMQKRDLNRLMKLLDKLKPDVLCGDFNAPRGGEIWARLAEKFIDNIPVEIKTTLDPKLHYANGVKLVVDGFFTAPKSNVSVKSLRLINGVSDHLAIAAELIT